MGNVLQSHASAGSQWNNGCGDHLVLVFLERICVRDNIGERDGRNNATGSGERFSLSTTGTGSHGRGDLLVDAARSVGCLLSAKTHRRNESRRSRALRTTWLNWF